MDAVRFQLDYTSINIAILNKLTRIIMDWLNELYIMTSSLFDKSTKRYIVLIRILWENSIVFSSVMVRTIVHVKVISKIMACVQMAIKVA